MTLKSGLPQFLVLSQTSEIYRSYILFSVHLVAFSPYTCLNWSLQSIVTADF